MSRPGLKNWDYDIIRLNCRLLQLHASWSGHDYKIHVKSSSYLKSHFSIEVLLLPNLRCHADFHHSALLIILSPSLALIIPSAGSHSAAKTFGAHVSELSFAEEK
jgi:hypothetical protein